MRTDAQGGLVAADRLVLFVSSAPLPYHPRHYHLMAVALARAGLRVAMVAPPPRTAQPPGAVPLIPLRARGGRLARFAGAPLALCAALRLRPALVQIDNLDLLPWAALAKPFTRTRIVYDSNDHYPTDILVKEWLPLGVRAPLARLVGVLEPLLAARLDGVSAADHATATSLRRFGADPEIVLNYPWRSFAEACDPAGATPHDVLYHGSLPSSYLDRIVATASLLAARGRQVRWCLSAVDYRADERRVLEARLAAAGLSSAFTVHYDLPYGGMPGLVSSTRIGFVPLPDEPKFRRSIPRKIFEFMAAGRPFIASNLPATQEQVAGLDCCILVAPGDDVASADAIELLLDEPEHAARLGARGRAAVLGSLNAEASTRVYVERCRALVDERHHERRDA